jgi:hypothetical protein
MATKADHLADKIETSAEGLIEELHAVRDSVEELYILLDHIWRLCGPPHNRHSVAQMVMWRSSFLRRHF